MVDVFVQSILEWSLGVDTRWSGCCFNALKKKNVPSKYMESDIFYGSKGEGGFENINNRPLVLILASLLG